MNDSKAKHQPRYYGEKEHGIRDDQIDAVTQKIIRTLEKNGHQGYVVGGALRDILLGRSPKDFDVVTNASPEEIHKIFPSSFIVGRRFRLVYVREGGKTVEVSTFRGKAKGPMARIKSMLSFRKNKYHDDNVYGTMEEDVERRDITINALYYDIRKKELIDFASGYEDIKSKQLRIIGDPEVRFTEDPMRILRLARFAAKLGFDVPDSVLTAIDKLKKEISTLPSPRLFDEFHKLFFTGHAQQSWSMLLNHQLLNCIFYYDWGKLPDDSRKLLDMALEDTDRRQTGGQKISMNFLLSLFLWPKYQYNMTQGFDPLSANNKKFRDRSRRASSNIWHDQKKHTMAVPLRFSWKISKIWELQYEMLHIERDNPRRLVGNRNFKLAYDILKLRSKCDPDHAKLKKAVEFWKDYAEESSKLFSQKDEGDDRNGRGGRGGRRGGRSRGGGRRRGGKRQFS